MSIDPDLTRRVDQFFYDEGINVHVREDFNFGNPPLSIREDRQRWAPSIVDRTLESTDEAVRSSRGRVGGKTVWHRKDGF